MITSLLFGVAGKVIWPWRTKGHFLAISVVEKLQVHAKAVSEVSIIKKIPSLQY
jgi:hypothetical protein